MVTSETQLATILLYGHDRWLVETRAWVLEREGYTVHTALHLTDFERTAVEEPIDLFLLCDSLDLESRSDALSLIHLIRPRPVRLVLAPIYFPAETEPTEKVFHAMEGPEKLVRTIRTLIANGSASACQRNAKQKFLSEEPCHVLPYWS